jgi:large subunit ribosomal protein L29
MKIQEFRNLDDASLQVEVDKGKRELLDLRCQVALGEEVHPHRLKAVRRDIARMRTVQTEKQAAVAAEGGNA